MQPASSDNGGEGARRWALALAAVGSFVVVLDLLVVTTALTAIQRSLGASLAELEWTVNAYVLTFAVLLMTASAIGDRFGRRRCYAVGLTLFAAASAACALAPNVAALIAARAVQGVGAALVMPLALALLNASFPPERRAWAVGVYGSVTSIAVVLGPFLGGLVTQGLGWAWVFWLNVPVTLGAVPFVLTRVKESVGPRGGFDIPGLLLVTGGALGLVWGLVRGGDIGWARPETVSALGAGAVLLVAFVGWELRAAAPMLPMRLFRGRGFSAGNGAIFLLNTAMTGAIFYMTQYQQVALGQGPLMAGARLAPWGVAPFLLSARVGPLAARFGYRTLVVTGLVLDAAGMAWLAAVAGPHTSYPALLAPMIISGIGFGLAIPATTTAVTSTVDRADLGRASGVFSTMRQLGGAFGVALLSVAFTRNGSYATPRTYSDGFVAVLSLSAAVFSVAALIAALLPRRTRTPEPPQPQAIPTPANPDQRTAPQHQR